MHPGGEVERVDELVAEAVGELVVLRKADPLPAPPALSKSVQGLIDKLGADLTSAGMNTRDREDISFAMVAFADEIFLEKSEEIQDHWRANLLQAHYFKTNDAGAQFFDRLETARREGRKDVVRALYLVILLGFQGRYRIQGGQLELDALARELSRDLGLDAEEDSTELAPRAERPRETVVRVARGGNRILLSVAAGALALAIVLYVVLVGLSAVGGSSAADFIDKLAIKPVG